MISSKFLGTMVAQLLFIPAAYYVVGLLNGFSEYSYSSKPAMFYNKRTKKSRLITEEIIKLFINASHKIS